MYVCMYVHAEYVFVYTYVHILLWVVPQPPPWAGSTPGITVCMYACKLHVSGIATCSFAFFSCNCLKTLRHELRHTVLYGLVVFPVFWRASITFGLRKHGKRGTAPTQHWHCRDLVTSCNICYLHWQTACVVTWSLDYHVYCVKPVIQVIGLTNSTIGLA